MNLPAASRRVSNFNKEIYLFSPCGKPQGIIKLNINTGGSSFKKSERQIHLEV